MTRMGTMRRQEYCQCESQLGLHMELDPASKDHKQTKQTNKLCVVANVCNPSTWERRQKDPEFSLFTNRQISRDLEILGEGMEISQGCFYLPQPVLSCNSEESWALLPV